MVKMAILTEAGNKTWDRVKTDPFYKEMLDEVKAAAQKFEKTPVEALKFSEFNLFYQTGNRMVYETAYFERRGRLNAYALLYLVYREQKYLSPVSYTHLDVYKRQEPDCSLTPSQP